MPNLTNSISVSVSTPVIHFKPGGVPACFTVEVVNESNQFATFQLDLKAEGADPDPRFHWYNLSPEVCAKKPPGDRTQFSIAITDSPVADFVGTINLLITIFSLELRQEERQIIRLVVEPGTAAAPLRVSLPIQAFQVEPGGKLAIPARVMNPNHQSIGTVLKLQGIDAAWFVDGSEQVLQLKPGGEVETLFHCQPPLSHQVISRVYPFTIEASQRTGAPAKADGTLAVLPIGHVEFSGSPDVHQIPTTREDVRAAELRLTSPELGDTHPTAVGNSVVYDLNFNNASNLQQQVGVEIRGDDQHQCLLQVIPERADIPPGEQATLQLIASKRRPLLGPVQTLLFEVAAIVFDDRTDIHNDDQTLELRVKPVVPVWLQILAALLLLALLGWLLTQRFEGHTAAVNSVRFSGNANQVISGSNDQTIRRWHVKNDHLEPDGVLAKTDQKAVRAVRYQPLDNRLVAAGLENGQIQLWNVLPSGVKISQDPVQTFSYQGNADRVLSLAFTKASNYLFSGHGSGRILQWEIDPNQFKGGEDKRPVRQLPLDFAVSDMALVGPGDTTLAIGGRFNRLALWNWTQPSNQPLKKLLYTLPYPAGDQNNYISSLATAENLTALDDRSPYPNLLATADNQGRITLWDIRRCLGQKATAGCEVQLDQWQDGHGGKPVRSLALSANGCYLASTGDDGRAMLWPLNAEGKRDSEAVAGREIERSSTKLNAINLVSHDDGLRVVTGGDDNRVRLYRVQESRADCR